MKLTFTGVAALTLLTGFCQGATLADFQNDINNINGNYTAFTNAVSAFTSNVGIMSFIPVATTCQGILVAVKQGVADGQTLPQLSVIQAATLAPAITTLAANTATTLVAVGAAQSMFAQIPMVGQLVQIAISALLVFFQGLSTSFENAVLAIVPTAAQTPFLAAQSTVNTAFSSAIAIFNSGPL